MGIRTSDNVAVLVAALNKAQSKFGAAIKDAYNPLYKSKYADVSSVINATLEHLNSNGIILMQHPSLEWKENVAYVTVTTRVQIEDQWIESDLTVPAIQRDKFDAQSVGTGITYACRYALQAILCIPREDDDGNAASGRGTSADAQALVPGKIDALKAKMGKKDAPSDSTAVPSLFYVHTPSGFYEIMGDEGLKSMQRDVLKRFWQPNAKAILCTDEELEGLKYEFEQRKVPFSLLKEPK